MKKKIVDTTKISVSLKVGNLPNHEWVVYTLDSMTQNAISEYVSQQGNKEVSSKEFHYLGKAYTGFSVPFTVVEFLRKNKADYSYKYIAFHKEKGKSFRLWLEGRKTAGQYLNKILMENGIFSLNNLKR